MVNPKISVIIPVYNCERYLVECLSAVFNSDYDNFEVIVVNDGSTDNSIEVARGFPCKIINLEKNQGVANARNKGAESAEGEILVFLDSDIVVEKDTLSNFARNHRDKNMKICHCQIYPESLTKGFIPDLLALTWHHYNRLMRNGSSFIPTEAFSITKDVFNDIGRFNTNFQSAGGEEFEIGTSMRERGYKIELDQSFHIHHHFQKFWPRCKTLFRRSSVYAKIVLKRNFRLDKGHGTLREGINAMLSMTGISLLAMSLFWHRLGLFFLMMVILQLLLDLDLNFFIIKRRGLLFFVKAIPVNYIWYMVMGLGVLKGILEHISWKLR